MLSRHVDLRLLERLNRNRGVPETNSALHLYRPCLPPEHVHCHLSNWLHEAGHAHHLGLSLETRHNDIAEHISKRLYEETRIYNEAMAGAIEARALAIILGGQQRKYRRAVFRATEQSCGTDIKRLWRSVTHTKACRRGVVACIEYLEAKGVLI